MPRGWIRLPDEDPAEIKDAKPTRRGRSGHHIGSKSHSSKPPQKESEQQTPRSRARSESRSREIKLPFSDNHKQWAYRKYYYIGYIFDDPRMKNKLIRKLERKFDPVIDKFYSIRDEKSIHIFEITLPEYAILHDGKPKGCFEGFDRVPYVWLVVNRFVNKHQGSGIRKLPNPFDDEDESTLGVDV
jgi:hypothetical protein